MLTLEEFRNQETHWLHLPHGFLHNWQVYSVIYSSKLAPPIPSLTEMVRVSLLRVFARSAVEEPALEGSHLVIVPVKEL